MSFQNKDFLMARNAECLIGEEPILHEVSSGNESKRGHQWFTGPCEQEILYSKRQAIERATGRDTSMSFLYRDYRSSSQPAEAQYIDNLFGPDHIMNSNNAGRNILPAGAENLIREGQGQGFGDCVGNPSFANYSKSYNILSKGQSFNKGDGNFVAGNEVCENGDDRIISVDPTSNRGSVNLVTTRTSFNKANEKYIPMAHTFSNGTGSIPLVVQNYNICSGGMISSYDILMNGGGSEYGHNRSVEGNAVQNISVSPPVATPKSVTVSKKKGKKEAKNLSPNGFPLNVKSLLSTGILDGVPVMYVSWSRDKKLQGIIKGTGYVCGCKDCNLSNVLNSFEFERHAGWKTKHPNNHIYFENGKTIYAVVQELKSTPPNLLLEVIAKVTGSSINWPNFEIWKASYLAATCELSRSYGDREVAVPS